MFSINNDKSIHLTRGDIAIIEIGASKSETENYTFKEGDIIRIRVFEKNHHENVVIQKDVTVESETTSVDISLYKEDTKIGELINKPKDYWYEVELNPDTSPQTIIGYDVDGPKLFRLYPEGADIDEHSV